MSHIIGRKSAPKLDALLKRVNSRNRKHKVLVTCADTVTPINTYWDGGSINNYAAIGLESFTYHDVPAPTSPPQFGGGEPQPFTLTDNIIVVCFGTFRGKTAAPHVYGTKTALAKLDA